MSTVVVIQARTGSTRLPGKILLPLAGKTLVERMVERVLAATSSFEVVLATTTDAVDEPVERLARTLGVRCLRGHPEDLLDRHLRAASSVGARVDHVVKIPSDCPLIDPAVIDRVLRAHLASRGNDFTSNLHPATYPDGNDVEVMTLEALEIAHREAVRPFEREHTTPFLWDRPERFRVGNVSWETGLDYSMTHRFTIDYPADYEFVKAVYDALYTSSRRIFSMGEILSLLERRPDILALNRRYTGVNWYRHHVDELRTIGRGAFRAAEEVS